MNSLPLEILESIITHIPTNELSEKCLIDRTWYRLVRIELYHRLKECMINFGKSYWEYTEIDKIYEKISHDDDEFSNVYNKAGDAYCKLRNDIHEQTNIERIMLRYGMIVDEEERKILEHNVTKKEHWDPYGLEWSWNSHEEHWDPYEEYVWE
jgi:hypothetical protein